MNFFLISELNLFQIEALIPCTITSCPCNKSLEKDKQRCLSFSSGALGDEEQQGKSFECRVKWFFSEEERCMGQTGAISWSSIQAGAGTLLRDQPILVILLHFTVSDEASQGVWAHPHGLLCLCGFHISSQGIAPPLHSSPTMHSWLCRYIHIHIQCTYLYTIAIYRVCTPCVCVCVFICNWSGTNPSITEPRLQHLPDFSQAVYRGSPALPCFLLAQIQQEVRCSLWSPECCGSLLWEKREVCVWAWVRNSLGIHLGCFWHLQGKELIEFTKGRFKSELGKGKSKFRHY